jgi:hypothetical protein
MIYLFTYDLHPALFRNVEPLKRELRSSPAWCNYLERTWLIGTYETEQQLHARVARHLTNRDFWFITRITQGYFGRLPKEAWDWVQETSRIMGI